MSDLTGVKKLLKETLFSTLYEGAFIRVLRQSPDLSLDDVAKLAAEFKLTHLTIGDCFLNDLPEIYQAFQENLGKFTKPKKKKKKEPRKPRKPKKPKGTKEHRNRYSDSLQKKALKFCETHTFAEAETKFGIPKGTISYWHHAASKKKPKKKKKEAKPRLSTEATRARYDARVLKTLRSDLDWWLAEAIRKKIGGTPHATRTSLARLYNAGQVTYKGQGRGTRYKLKIHKSKIVKKETSKNKQNVV